MSRLFDVGSSSLDPGITLIEASAGTGKTFAIAGMVVRLVAETGLPLSRILVVTFTEAATQELRDRVRTRLREAVVLLEEGRTKDDPALANLGEAAPDAVTEAIRNLKNALLSFDEAAIFTIHGFCQRMLRENAFETGALFDVELLSDAEPLWRETAEDFWRKQFYTVEPEIAALVNTLGRELSIQALIDLVRKLARHPELKILGTEDSFSLQECKSRLVGVVADLRREWRASQESIGATLRGSDALSVNKTSGYPSEVIEALLEELTSLEGDSPPSSATLAAVRKLSARELESKTKKKKITPSHPFFDLCARFGELREALVRLVRREFMATLGEGLVEAKQRRNVVTFDDLLTRLYYALKSPEGPELASAIGSRFAVALIDEFQDTDPVQWEIFHRVFGGGEHLLFLIGDPKQAIYGFRGADIFTYMEARLQAGAHYTLGKNWRSDQGLVEAANQLFSRHGETFVFPEIAFQPVQAAAKEGAAELDLGASGLCPRPLQLCCVGAEDGGDLSVEEAKGAILVRMLGEIQRLLSGKIVRSGRLLEPGDIAVLVRTNLEGESVRECLVEAGIPAVLRTDRSVLQTKEAEHLLRLLGAILEPQRNGLVKAALASPLFGLDGGGLHALDQNEAGWQEVTAKFHQWQDTWSRHGFMRMFRSFLTGEQLRARLLGLLDGERMVTNYQHIAECLHAVEYEQILTPSALLRWLREQNERSEGEGERFVIRLEKDEKAVQIVTIHRSKGLEYPVVFCPFNWTQVVGRLDGKDILFHDAADGNRLTWDMRAEPTDENKEAFKREQLAEAMRLLYVAVTRARNRCYLFWALTKGSDEAGNCALAQAFGCGTGDGPATPLGAFEQLAAEGEAGLAQAPAEAAAPGRYRIGKTEGSLLSAQTFRGGLQPAPLITSFSGLTARAHDEAPDRDAWSEAQTPAEEEPQPELEGEPVRSIFNFPKGARAGNFFHGILETLDFTRPDQVEAEVERELAAYRFEPEYGPVVAATLRGLLEHPLSGGFCLADIGWKDRLVEAPLYFPIRPVTPGELAQVFEGGDLPPAFARGVGRLGFYPVDGYMTGFIDLIVRHEDRYYLIDWKSNWLGPRVTDYQGAAMERAMAESYYYLQYHLYTLALHRHLGASLPDYDYDRHFGGVFYIFLRGLDRTDPSSGVFHARPPRSLIDNLQDVLMPEAKVEVLR